MMEKSKMTAWAGFCTNGAPISYPTIRVINPPTWPHSGPNSSDRVVAVDLNGDGTPGISDDVRCDVPEDGQCDYYLNPVPPEGTVMCFANGALQDGIQSWICGTLDSEGNLTDKKVCMKPV